MKPVEKFVMEKLALPAWMRRLPGFVKGRPWQAWSGEARAAGQARARQHVARRAIRESAGYEHARLPLLAEKAKAPLQGAVTELGPLVQQIKSPRMRQLLTTPSTRRAIWLDPLLGKTPAMRQREVQKLMGGPLQMGRLQAVRTVAGIGKSPRLRRMEELAQSSRMAPAHMTPAPGQTGAFYELMGRAPAALQPRFRSIEQQVLARQAARAQRAALEGAKTIRPGRAFVPIVRTGDFI